MTAERVPPLHPVVRFVATGAFLGYSKVAPGTVGSLGCALLVWLAVPQLTPASAPAALTVYLASVAALLALAVWASDAAERAFGKDSPRIVIDEFAGFVLSVLLLPKTPFVFAAAFLLFRVVDILKPFPARRAEVLPGGVGIVADDVVAGAYANVLLRVMLAAGS